VTGPALQVGDNSRDVLLTPSGDRLYVPFAPTKPGTGGIGIVEVSEQDCQGIIWRHLKGCPSCDKPDCVVLATVEHYAWGYKIEDQTDPASDPDTDENDKVARIDNRKGRLVLPSTAVLLEMLECLMEKGCGGCVGTQGPPGTPGTGATVETEAPGANCTYGGLKITDGRVIPDFARDILAGRDIVMHSDGSPARTFCYVADAVAGYYRILTRGRPGEPYNIGTSGPEITVAELADAMVGIGRELFGYQGSVVVRPSRDGAYLTDNPARRCPDITKARTELGHEPSVGFHDGLRRTLIWYSANQNEGDEA